MEHKIIYNDFAALADRNASMPAEGSSDYQHCTNLLDEDLRNVLNYATFETKGINLLDNTLYFAQNADNCGFVSAATSNSVRELNPAVALVTALSDGYYSAPGITLHFWQNFCTEFSVAWYKDGAQIAASDVSDCNSLDYYIENAVEDFNKVVITFKKTETAFQFVKLKGIDLGKAREITKFFGAIGVFHEISDDCSDLPGATCDFEAILTEDFSPQSEQEMFFYSDGTLVGKFTVDNAEQNGAHKYAFECSNDAMKLEADFPATPQGEYTVNELAQTVADVTNIDIDVSDFGETALTGFFEKGTARQACAMLSFAAGCFASSFKRKKLTFCKPRNRRNKIITANQILGEAKYKTNAPYSAIVLKTFNGSFDNIENELRHINPAKKANSSVGEKIYEKYSFMSDAEHRFEEIKECGFHRNEITATIVLKDEQIGDILSIETPYNGIKTGIIKSMDISYSTAVTAEIVIIERGYAENGGEA